MNQITKEEKIQIAKNLAVNAIEEFIEYEKQNNNLNNYWDREEYLKNSNDDLELIGHEYLVMEQKGHNIIELGNHIYNNIGLPKKMKGFVLQEGLG